MRTLKLSNDHYGFFENDFNDLNKAIIAANNHALYYHLRAERDYAEDVRKYKICLENHPEYWTGQEPQATPNFKIEVSLVINENKDDRGYRTIYSISRNKIRDMYKAGLISPVAEIEIEF